MIGNESEVKKTIVQVFFFLLPTDVLIDVYLFRYVEKAFEDSSLKMSIFKFIKILLRGKKKEGKKRGEKKMRIFR